MKRNMRCAFPHASPDSVTTPSEKNYLNSMTIHGQRRQFNEKKESTSK